MCNPLHVQAMKDLMNRLQAENACPGGLINLLLAAYRLYVAHVHQRVMLEGAARGASVEETETRAFNLVLNGLADRIGGAMYEKDVPQEDFLLLITSIALGVWVEYDPDAAFEGGITPEGSERPDNPGDLLRMLADQLDEAMDVEALHAFDENYNRYKQEDLEAEIEANGGAAAIVADMLKGLGIDPDSQVH